MGFFSQGWDRQCRRQHEDWLKRGNTGDYWGFSDREKNILHHTMDCMDERKRHIKLNLNKCFLASTDKRMCQHRNDTEEYLTYCMHISSDNFDIAWGCSRRIELQGQRLDVELQKGDPSLNSWPNWIDLDSVILKHSTRCHKNSLNWNCTSTGLVVPHEIQPHKRLAVIYYCYFRSGTGALKEMVKPVPCLKWNHAISLPLTRAIYCQSPKWTSCLQTDITHDSDHCQVLDWRPLRCLKTAIHICAGSPFTILNIPLNIFIKYSCGDCLRVHCIMLYHPTSLGIIQHLPYYTVVLHHPIFLLEYDLLYFTLRGWIGIL